MISINDMSASCKIDRTKKMLIGLKNTVSSLSIRIQNRWVGKSVYNSCTIISGAAEKNSKVT